MSDYKTMARPYAKALFAHALSNKSLELWTEILSAMSFVYTDKQTQSFLQNPASTPEQQVELFDLVQRLVKVEEEKEPLNNFVALLAENKRMQLIPEIENLFNALRAEHEKTIKVQLKSYQSISKAQKDKLISALEKRLHCKVQIEETIDKEILGGAIIQAGDFVIDGSVRGKLNKLAATIAA